MDNSTLNTQYDFGMIGLGTMGRNLLLNIADNGFAGAGYDKDATKAALLESEGKEGVVKGFTDIQSFVHSLKSPRAIMMLVPAGKIVDVVIEELLPLLDAGDVLIDGGNSYFTDTDRRATYLKDKGLHFFGMGVSGGEEGARRGPSMMPGGDKAAYAIMKPTLEAIAAKVDGEPCVAYMGPGSAGHFVKMVHNGIEYGLMQLISEFYAIMKNGLQMSNESIADVFAEWNDGRLQSFLIEITRDILRYKAPDSDHALVDDIKDEARAKGTGKWTSQVAMDLETPLPTVDTAVAMRDLSKYKALRVEISPLYAQASTPLNVDHAVFLKQLEQAFYFAMVISYAQGMHMLSRASTEYKYGLNMAEITKIWRGGCIIRSSFLGQMFNAYKKDTQLAHLLLDADIARLINGSQVDARQVVMATVGVGIATPALTSTVGYFDSLRSARMPSNVIQAQRDYFGAHTYELVGQEGSHHTQWTDK